MYTHSDCYTRRQGRPLNVNRDSGMHRLSTGEGSPVHIYTGVLWIQGRGVLCIGGSCAYRGVLCIQGSGVCTQGRDPVYAEEGVHTAEGSCVCIQGSGVLCIQVLERSPVHTGEGLLCIQGRCTVHQGRGLVYTGEVSCAYMRGGPMHIG